MRITLQREDGASLVLLACCADMEGTGGLYAFDGERVSRIDSLNSSSATTNGGLLVRLLWSPPGGPVGIMSYDRSGLLSYRRIDAHGDAHHVAVYGLGYLVASTSTNSVITLSSTFDLVGQWTAPGRGDAWHINGTFVKDSDVFVSAFGRFAAEREWGAHQKDGSGIVFNFHTGENVLTGLSAPHHPRLIDGNWVVCSSALHRVLVVAADSSRVVAELQLDGWTRGIAETPDYIFIGISAPRHDSACHLASASIAVVCRRNLKVVDRIAVDAKEIGDLCLVDAELVEGCCRGRDQTRAILTPSAPGKQL